MRERSSDIRDALAQERGGGAAACGEHEFARAGINHGDARRQHRGQGPLDVLLNAGLALAARQEFC
ncbi:MAG TPA: hypothetical protein VEN29_10135 [Casimicrobiaceae bacterium]|nr:hypothetical protein [Casimicrobiaceae bacterium]